MGFSERPIPGLRPFQKSALFFALSLFALELLEGTLVSLADVGVNCLAHLAERVAFHYLGFGVLSLRRGSRVEQLWGNFLQCSEGEVTKGLVISDLVGWGPLGMEAPVWGVGGTERGGVDAVAFTSSAFRGGKESGLYGAVVAANPRWGVSLGPEEGDSRIGRKQEVNG